jgi:hypothetical protein
MGRAKRFSRLGNIPNLWRANEFLGPIGELRSPGLGNHIEWLLSGTLFSDSNHIQHVCKTCAGAERGKNIFKYTGYGMNWL